MADPKPRPDWLRPPADSDAAMKNAEASANDAAMKDAEASAEAMDLHEGGSGYDDSDDDASPDDGVTNMIAQCVALKAEGNEHFKAGEVAKATEKYQDAVKRLTSDAGKKALKEYHDRNAGAEDTATPLLASLHTNTAACYVKTQQWDSAAIAATAALKAEPANVKALFRRGVANSHLTKWDEAKADLTAVARADPKNREARTVLETVNAALKERANSERAMYSQAMGKALSGPSLYAKEEARAAAAAKAAAEKKKAEEAALLQEWRDECDALRKAKGPNPTAELLASAAAGGDAEARNALDKLAPITLEEFGEAKIKAAKKEKERLDKEEAARKAERDKARAQERTARSDVTRLEAEDEDEEALLRGLNKGYKLKADGSKTSYFDRSEKVDPATLALLEAQKAPKRIESSQGGAPAAAGAAAGGSAWNAGGTYEERDVSAWGHEELKSRLSGLSAPVAGGRGELKVKEVKNVEGHISVISSRGKVKRPFEVKFDLCWECHDTSWSEGEGDPANACDGTLAFSDVSPAPTGVATDGAACIYEIAPSYGTAPAADNLEAVQDALITLRDAVDTALAGFVDALAQK